MNRAHSTGFLLLSGFWFLVRGARWTALPCFSIPGFFFCFFSKSLYEGIYCLGCG